MVAVTNVFAAGDVIASSKINTNFNDLAAALSQLRTGNLAADAGVTSRQIAQRFALTEETICIVPYSAGTSLQSPTLFTPPTAFTSIHKKTLRLLGGQECYLSEVELYAVSSTNGGFTNFSDFQVLKNSVVIGGAAITVNTSGDYWRIRNSDPIQNPLISAQDADVLEFQVRKTDGGQAIAGWYVTYRWKKEFVS